MTLSICFTEFGHPSSISLPEIYHLFHAKQCSSCSRVHLQLPGKLPLSYVVMMLCISYSQSWRTATSNPADSLNSAHFFLLKIISRDMMDALYSQGKGRGLHQAPPDPHTDGRCCTYGLHRVIFSPQILHQIDSLL